MGIYLEPPVPPTGRNPIDIRLVTEGAGAKTGCEISDSIYNRVVGLPLERVLSGAAA